MSNHLIVFSSKLEKESAFSEVLEKITSESKEKPSAIIYFSDLDNFEYYTQQFSKNFSQTNVIGATTYINFCSVGTAHEALSAIVLYSDFECSAGILHEAGRRPVQHIENIYKAVNELSSTQNTICLEFTNSFTNGEELVMDTFVKALDGTGITVAGSSCGAKAGTTDSLVGLNGKVYRDSCVFILIRNLNGKIFLYKENIYKPTRNIFTVTSVDCDKRKVYEYDGMPAAQVLARTLNIKVSDLESYFIDHPMGRIYKDECFLMEGNEVLEDDSITYFTRIYNHTKVALLTAEPFNVVWNKTTEAVSMAIKEPQFMISINCLARTCLFENENMFGDFTKSLSRTSNEFIGISGYGEQMDGVHFNQTMVLVIFE